MDLSEFLKTSFTSYHAVANAEEMLSGAGFCELYEQDLWTLAKGGKYYVKRGGSIVAFRYGGGPFRIVASHTDSPCFKLKENAPLTDGSFTRLNAEPYGGGLWYTFLDRPLRIAGRIIAEEDGSLCAKNYVSSYPVVIPSLAIHQNREANDKFSFNAQTELALLGLGKQDLGLGEDVRAYDLFLVPDEAPFESGADLGLLSSPRLDNLTSVYFSLSALAEAETAEGTTVAACLEGEEIGSRTYAGAGSDFLRSVLWRIAEGEAEERLRQFAKSFLISLDNAHSLHPDHPETCDPTNRAVLGGGVVIKGHAGGAYTTDGMTSAVIKTIFSRAGVKYQTFYNRSDVRSGSTLGAILFSGVSIPSADLGLAQLAMHSAVETMAKSDFSALQKGLTAFYKSKITLEGSSAAIE